MAKRTYPAIVLFIDQNKDELVVSLLKQDEAALPDQSEMRRLFCLNLAKLRRDDGDAGERLAASMLAALTHLGDTTLGYGGYKKLSEIASKRLDASVKNGLQRGDPEWQYYVAWDHVKASTDHGDPTRLDIAEDYFKKAAAGGYDVAIQFLEYGWPGIKAERLRAIEAKRQGRG